MPNFNQTNDIQTTKNTINETKYRFQHDQFVRIITLNPCISNL